PADLSSLADSALTLEEAPVFSAVAPGFDTPLLPPGNYDHFAVELVWGNLQNVPSSSVAPKDWTGGLKLGFQGGVFPVALIDFEEGQDSLLLINSIGAVAWVSKTHNDFDGVVLDIYYDKDICYFAPPLFYFETVSYKRAWYAYELFDLDEVYQVDNENSLAIKSRLVEDGACPRGRLAGIWVHKDHNNGYFYGRWMSDQGVPTGYLFGKFWTENTGERCFKGVWVTSQMTLQGYLWGEWKYTGTDPTVLSDTFCREGIFAGQYTDRNSTIKGRLKGKFGLSWPWADVARVEPWRSFFAGYWEQYCPAVQPR
ncbi:MAG: hypothetical protein OEW00_12040, partial [candidate division Zixibacteria bacterium]|nr:hypothetical protein [candidate division Zixibacteria bacterium]